MLLKSERKSLGPNNSEVTSESYFHDYKDVSGVKLPMKQITNHDGAKFLEITITDTKVMEKVDDSTFAKP
jgi:hypothetical protein